MSERVRRLPAMTSARLLVVLCLSIAGLVAAPVPAAIADVDPGCHATQTGYTCFYGPIVVPRGGSIEDVGLVVGPPQAGFVTSARATLVRADGTAVPHHAVHLHHAVWADIDQEDLTCPGWPDRFFATGKERTKIELPVGYGYWMNGGSLGLGYHLDSMHGRHEVYLKLKLGYTEDTEGSTLTPIRPVWLDVDNCSDSEFNVPRNLDPGRHKEVWDYAMPVGGRFVALAGHLHDGGLKLRLRNVTTNTSMFTSRAVYEYRWNLTAMTTYSDAAGIPVAAGDVLELTAVYNDTRDGPGTLAWPDVMGIMVGAFVPAE
jgi:hypothetical protein